MAYFFEMTQMNTDACDITEVDSRRSQTSVAIDSTSADTADSHSCDCNVDDSSDTANSSVILPVDSNIVDSDVSSGEKTTEISENRDLHNNHKKNVDNSSNVAGKRRRLKKVNTHQIIYHQQNKPKRRRASKTDEKESSALDPKIYECHRCRHKCHSEKGLIHHLDEKHPQKISPPMEYSCFECSIKFTDEGKLQVHIEVLHTLFDNDCKEYYQCHKCYVKFRNFNRYKFHTKREQRV